MNRKLTRAAIAAVGFFFLIFGYQQAFVSPYFLYTILAPGLGRADIGYELVGMLFMSVGAGILVRTLLFYRHRDKQ